MAYRVKGVFTKKQRGGLADFIHNYYTAVTDPAVDVASKTLIEAVFQPFVILSLCALYMDDCQIINRVITKGD